MTSGNIRLRGFDEFIRALGDMGDEAKQDFKDFLDLEGFQFLDAVQDKIIAMEVVDTRRLLNSFDQGSTDGMWSFTNGGLTLSVGTNVEYAAAVNDGHKQKRRWVPGVWNNGKFEYRPGADTGMMLTEKFIPGRPYWDNAVQSFERIFQEDGSEWFSKWVDELRRRHGFQ